MKKTKNLLLALSTGALVIASATACTSDTTAAPSETESASSIPTSSPSPTPTPTFTTTPMSAVQPGEEYDPEEADRWVANLTQNIPLDTILTGVSGHVGPDSSTKFTLTDTELEAGTYSYYFACRGDGDITFTIENAGAPVTTIEGACTGTPQEGSFTLSEVTTDFVAISLDAPIDYLVRVTDELPG